MLTHLLTNICIAFFNSKPSTRRGLLIVRSVSMLVQECSGRTLFSEITSIRKTLFSDMFGTEQPFSLRNNHLSGYCCSISKHPFPRFPDNWKIPLWFFCPWILQKFYLIFTGFCRCLHFYLVATPGPCTKFRSTKMARKFPCEKVNTSIEKWCKHSSAWLFRVLAKDYFRCFAAFDASCSSSFPFSTLHWFPLFFIVPWLTRNFSDNYYTPRYNVIKS